MCLKWSSQVFLPNMLPLKFVLLELVAQDKNLGGVLGSLPLPLFPSDSKFVPLINCVIPSFAKV